MQNEFTKTVESAQEYNEAWKHADALGFEPVKYRTLGAWETDDGHAVFISSRETEIKWAGRKYFHAIIDGEETPIQPGTSRTKDRGTVKVTFAEK